MRILPVIDLKSGQVVRGVAGRRETYRPIQSCLCDSAAPHDVARALAAGLGRDEVYVADLDAIDGAAPDWGSLSDIAATGLRLWVDAGVQTAEDAERLAARQLEASGETIERVIVGLESVAGPTELEVMLDRTGSGRLVFSLDLNAGRPMARWPTWHAARPVDIVRQVYEMGIRRIIVLDLAQVGSGDGVSTLPLCRQIAEFAPDMRIITGGGVAHPDDLANLAAAGFEAALVASALHDGRIRRSDIDEIEAL